MVDIKGGKIIAYSDNRFLINKHYSKVKKSSDYTKEASGIIGVMWREVKQMLFEVSLEYLNDKPCPNKEFHQ